MRFVLLSAGQRWLLIAAVIALAVLAGWLGRRGRPRNAVLAGAGAALALGVLAAEVMIAWSIGWWAPEGAQFNEYRWVLLSPWGRVGIALGVVCVIAIVLLARRSSRGAPLWRRVAMITLRGGAATAALVMFLEPAIELRQVALMCGEHTLTADLPAAEHPGYCLLYTSPSPRDRTRSRMPSSA